MGQDADANSTSNIPTILEDLLAMDGYTATKQIGKGGFATVYEGYDQISGATVAIKYIKKKYVIILVTIQFSHFFCCSLLKPEDKILLENEIAAYRSLDHPSIVKVL